ncbi:metal ABC transporter ATP-binding protein [bacterium]|nr:MAG: metal ABC transporter ATP-binding protein [bacterium]
MAAADGAGEPAAGALELDGVGAGYGSTFHLGGISFQAGAGSVVGLIGPNGGGKSTLLKAVAGVIPLREGQIRLGGRPLRRNEGHIAFVPQREEVNWDFPVSAGDVVLMGRYRAAGWVRRPGAEDRRKAGAALARLGLEGKGNRHISQFSGGQQQRIFLARALVQEPRVVLLDEPFTGIDQENREVLHQVIAGFARDGVIVLIATHDLDEVAAMTTHVCCLAGRFVAFGPTASAFTPETLRATFGGQLAVFA